ncbi:MAG: transporter, partial [Pseudomonadota bacterium]
MKKYLLTSAAMTIMASAAAAGGIDRSGQSIGLIFAETGATGGYAQLSFGNVSPSANADFTLGGGLLPASSSPLSGYTQLGLGFKQQFNDAFSLSVIYDQPFGALVEY